MIDVEAVGSGDIGSRLDGRAIVSGLRGLLAPDRGRSGNEGILNSSVLSMLIGGPSVDVDVGVDLPSLAIFFGAATGALYPAVELEDDERDDDGRASIAYYYMLCI